MRIVSLFPSATELIAGIGATDELVGRSHQCDYPDEIHDTPVVTASALSDEVSAADDIDSAVDDHHHGEGTFFRVNTDRLQAVDPEVILTQSLCDVCAVPESMTVEALERLRTEPELISLGPTTIDGILDSIDRLGSALDRNSAATRLRTNLETRIQTVRDRRPTPPRPLRVVCLEWTDPLRCHGLWVPEMFDILGADDGFGAVGERGRVIEWDDVVAFDPDVLIVSPCGRPIPEIRQDMADLVERSRWNELTAVRNSQVYLLNGKISSRHGPRVVRTLELFAGILYPDAFELNAEPGEDVVRFRTGAD